MTRPPTLRSRVTMLALAVLASSAGANAQAVTKGTVFRAPSGATLRLILDDSTVGPAVSMGELTFPPNMDSGEHVHGATEILYVLSGELEHTVNGETTILKPGMTGYVRPPGKIRHKTGAAGAKVLVIWAPGDEAKKITARWTREP
ncbi:MAG TPA: cupin domain-containing protein [Gemmatimonadaceae bacterium]|nr:cupin domain-containing protein [Gemmatimonadaceae bacterium]